jgi:hypothetical protein
MHQSLSQAASCRACLGFVVKRGLECSWGVVRGTRGNVRRKPWRLLGGENPESFNPRDGFGMKQGRADERGTKRQEVEKT